MVTVTCAVLFSCATAGAQTASLGIRPVTTSASGPLISAETETGDSIQPTTMEVTSVLVGPLVVTKLSIGLEPTGSVVVRVQMPAGATIVEADCAGDENASAPKALVSGMWKTRINLRYSPSLSLVYVQPLVHGQAVVVSTGEHSRLARLEATLTNQQGHELAESLVLTGAEAKGDVMVAVGGLAQAFRAGDLAMIELNPAATTSERIRDTVIAIDTSASTARAFRDSVERARELAQAVHGRLAVVAFDQTADVLFEGAAEALPDLMFEKVLQRGALGATHLEDALSAVEGLVRNREYRRVILLTDGRATAGARDRAKLVTLAARWVRFGVRRLDFVPPEVERDEGMLEALLGAGFVDHGRIISSNQDIVRQLEEKSAPELPVSVVGAVAQQPWRFTSWPTGAKAWILARVPKSIPLAVRLGNGAVRSLAAEAAWRPLLERYFEQQGLLVAPGKHAERARLDVENGKVQLAHQRRVLTRCGCTTVSGRLPPEAIQRIVRLNFGRFRGCTVQPNRAPVVPKGRVTVRFAIDLDGQVTSVVDMGSTVADQGFVQCVMQAFATLQFPPPEGGAVDVVYPLVFTDDETVLAAKGSDSRTFLDDIPTNYVPVKLANPDYPLAPRQVGAQAYIGQYRAVMEALAEKRMNDAEVAARKLRDQRPNELVTFLALGTVAKARGDLTEARRAFGSLLDRFGDNARLHRVAAAWLACLGDRSSKALAEEALEFALSLKGGRVETERQLAWLWAERGEYLSALRLMTAAFLHQESRQPTLLNQEIAILAAAAAAKRPDLFEAVAGQLRLSGTKLAATPSLIFAMQNESERGLALSIYTDPSHGVRFKATAFAYGDGAPPSAYEVAKEQRNAPYTLRVVDRGYDQSFTSQGTGLGHVRVLDFDGRGHVHIEFRPFVLQQYRGEVELATYG